MVSLSFSYNQVSEICKFVSMSCLRNFLEDKPGRTKKSKCMIGSGMHPELRGGKGTEEQQGGLKDLLGLDETHLGRAHNNRSDETISENDFRSV